jgi:predicted dehydrogenase
MEKTISPCGAIDFFEGGTQAEGVLEQKQWLEAVQGKGEPLVKPEQAFVVTQILEAIYKSAETGKEIVFD